MSLILLIIAECFEFLLPVCYMASHRIASQLPRNPTYCEEPEMRNDVSLQEHWASLAKTLLELDADGLLKASRCIPCLLRRKFATQGVPPLDVSEA